MLRLLIGTGFLLMAVGFGAAGWQYWQGLPGDEMAEEVERARDAEVWLISPSGVVVSRDDMQAYLTQDRLVPERMLHLTVTARLDDLLLSGETLPAAPYLEVLADIRAPRVGEDLCQTLTNGFARVCTLHTARVVPGSLNDRQDEARFAIDLAFRQDFAGVELPDFGEHVFKTEEVQPDPAVQPPPSSVQAALSELVAAARDACAAEDRVATCRVLGLTLDWAPGQPRTAVARIGWLSPLPDGMSRLPPIEPVPEG